MKVLAVLLVAIVYALPTRAQQVEIIKYPQLLQMINGDKEEDIIIYNFWATWCAPCVKEMPYFEKIDKEDGVQVRFISLDDVEKLESRVIPFLNKKNIQATVYLLDETDYNAFIDKVDKRWSGAIPATVIVNNKLNTKEFYEKEFHEGELEKVVYNPKQ